MKGAALDLGAKGEAGFSHSRCPQGECPAAPQKHVRGPAARRAVCKGRWRSLLPAGGARAPTLHRRVQPVRGGGPALTTIPPDPPRGAISGASGVLNPGSWGEQRSTKASWLCPQRPNPDPIGPRVWAARERVTEVTETPATWFLRVSRRDRLWSPRPPSALQQRRHTYFKLKKKKNMLRQQNANTPSRHHAAPLLASQSR